jgi:hypothetical protein
MADVGVKLLEDVFKRRWQFSDRRAHGKAETVRHPLAGVWILPQQHNADVFIWRQLQRGENLVFSGIDLQRKSLAFVIDELRQAFEVRFVEFRADYHSPRRGTVQIHYFAAAFFIKSSRSFAVSS